MEVAFGTVQRLLQIGMGGAGVGVGAAVFSPFLSTNLVVGKETC